MRIGIFTECYKPITNGVVVSVESFRQELAARGHEVWVFTPDYQSYADERVIPLRSIGLPARTLYRCATPWMRRPAPPHLDIVHAHSPFSTGLLARTLSRRYQSPLVFTYHTRLEDYAHYLPLPRALARRTLVWASRVYCNWTDMVLTPTPEIQRLLLGYGVSSRIEVLPTGIHLEGLERADGGRLRQRFGISAHARILLTVGRLAPEKNLPFLLQAFQAVHAAHPSTVLVVVGDGPDKPQLVRMVQSLGLEGAVHFAGMVERADIVHYYRGAELFVFASVTETQGLVVGEALQAGTPVVAVAAGGVADALRDIPGSVTCAPRVAEFSRLLQDVLADGPKLAQLRQGAAQLGSRLMDPGRSTSRLLTLYESLLEREKGRGTWAEQAPETAGAQQQV